MLIISARGHLKAQPADISVIGDPGMRKGLIGAKWTSTVALSRTAGQSASMVFNTAVFDNAGCLRPSVSYTRIYAPQTGWYFANAYLQTDSGTPHEAALQIHCNRINTFFAYRKRRFGPGSASIPNAISVTGRFYAYAGDYFYSYWVCSQAITSLAGEANLGFGIWKTS